MNNNLDLVQKVKQKRGRKSKKELQESQKLQELQELQKLQELNDNIIDNDENIICIEEEKEVTIEDNKTHPKKRGRKPKGGKIVVQIALVEDVNDTKPNIILHLKCSLKDLNLTKSNYIIESFNFSNKNELSYQVINNNSTHEKTYVVNDTKNDNSNDETILNNIEEHQTTSNNDCEIKNVWKKLKQLGHNLHVNNINDKKSACFWCTYEFDNPPVHIPKHFIKDTYNVYGCFCSPECASAFLMDENIDSSSKFERYHLLNHIYSKVYNYTKNIKPAPNPFYMLEKYYGNLTIQEYRTLLRNERLFLIVDKPLTRILPELHEDNDDFILNNKIIPSNTYQIKKKMQKKTQSKGNIINEQFGMS